MYYYQIFAAMLLIDWSIDWEWWALINSLIREWDENENDALFNTFTRASHTVGWLGSVTNIYGTIADFRNQGEDFIHLIFHSKKWLFINDSHEGPAIYRQSTKKAASLNDTFNFFLMFYRLLDNLIKFTEFSHVNLTDYFIILNHLWVSYRARTSFICLAIIILKFMITEVAVILRWDSFTFNIKCPELTFITFNVCHSDLFNFGHYVLGVFASPVQSIAPSYRHH